MTERDLKKDMDALKTDLDAVRRDLAALTETLRDSAKAQVAAGVAGAGAELDAVMTQLREAFDLPGVPLRLSLRKGRNPYAASSPAR